MTDRAGTDIDADAGTAAAPVSGAPVGTATVRHVPWERERHEPPMSTVEDPHSRYRLTDRSVLRDGRPVIPVSGEFHLTRVPRERWEERLRLMRAGGVSVVAFYVIWIHHEGVRGERRFDGDRDVAAFVDLCAAIGLDVVLRIGPWAHGEVRNGGFPDWVQEAPVAHRTDDPEYLALVEPWYAAIGEQLASRCGPDSPVVAIQLENELYDQPEHLRTLKRMARAAGLSAPIWTGTGWGGADLPTDEVMPVFGGYPDGFWLDHDQPWDDTFREHFFFSHVWDDPGIGADLRQGVALEAPRTPSELYPAATCELGGGMALAYQRRPRVEALDVAAVAHDKIGNGSAWQGYYMFAGGRNPGPDLQESQATGYPNDMAVFDYDFRAPIGATGRTSGSFGLLRRQHAMLAAFGRTLAEMPSSLPDVRPEGVRDSTTLRWALRSDGTSGVVLITWHQPHEPLEEHPGVRFEVVLEERTVLFPAEPLRIPVGTIAHWPVGLVLGGVELEWATASLLTVLEGERPTLVLVAEEGIAPELRFADGTALIVDGAAVDAAAVDGPLLRLVGDEPVLVTADGALDVLVLPAAIGAEAWALEGDSGVRLLLGAEPLWTDAEGRLVSDGAAVRPAPREYRDGTFVAVTGSVDAPADAPSVRPVVLEELRPAGSPPASYGGRNGRAAAPRDSDFAAHASAHRLVLPDLSARAVRRELEIDWAGDVARVLVDGVLRADRFWNADGWVLDLDDLGVGPGSEVVVEILPLPRGAEVRLPDDAEALRAASAEPLHELGAARVVDVFRWTQARD
ncbi:beta-galactosidase [Rathayibacter sp. ZW T2_19]|uniref:Beta-galactosidase n=1 Tax=Rathayibacter rubneri TaxID=2950106 RepID=A0A9X2DZR5_9MICO|nr:beta-galactosidase [Rathayibacter rubneri]MCM6764250.1 beta-galactosidase [Rathayibacter rubneri]